MIEYKSLEEETFFLFEEPKRETIYALLLSLGIGFLFTLIFVLRNQGATPVLTWTISEVIWYWILYGITFIIPVFILLYIRKNSVRTIGIQHNGLESSLTIGLFLVFLMTFSLGNFIVSLIVSPIIIVTWIIHNKFPKRNQIDRIIEITKSTGVQVSIMIVSISGLIFYGLNAGTINTGESILSMSAFYSILAHIAQSGGEELVFRGVLQFRAITWIGEKKGILLTSGIFALIHLGMLIYNGMNIVNIIITLAFIFFWGILTGYITHKTQNISGAILIHTMTNVL